MADDSGWSIDPAGGPGWSIDPDPATKQAWTLDPLAPKPAGNLLRAIEGGALDEERAKAADLADDDKFARIPSKADPASRPSLIDGGVAVDQIAEWGQSAVSGLVGGAGSAVAGLQEGSEAAQRLANRGYAKVFGQDFVDHWMQPLNDVWNDTGGRLLKGVGGKVEGLAEDVNVEEGKRDQVGNVVANALGQITGQIAISLVGGEGAGSVAYLGQSFDQLHDAIAEKGKEGTLGADAATVLAAPIMGLTEKLGIDKILERVPPSIKNRFMRGLVDVGIAGGIEAAQEVAEQFVQNIAIKAGVDPEQAITDGFVQSAEGGGGAGMVVRAILGRWGGRGTHATSAPAADDQLGGAANPPRSPQPGRQYSQADAIAELGMSPDEAATFASTGHDPRGTGVGQPGPLGIREGAALSPDITAADEASPLPTEKIVHGKMAIAAASATPVANEALRGAGMPDVGARVEVVHNGRTRAGAVADAWTVDVAGERSVGVKIKLDDGSTIEEPVGTLRDMGVVIRPETLGLPEGDLADPEVRKFVEQGLASGNAAVNAAAAPLGVEWAVDASEAPSAPERPSGGQRGGNLPRDVIAGLVRAGIPEHVARGAAAGTVAEARGDHTAVNPTSGALGIGQWLGPRKAELQRRYGPNPTREQQIEFLAWELKGGDFGGKAVLAARDEASALQAYITKFMRPAAGAETTGDLERGAKALGGVQIDMLGGRERSGAEIDADQVVERVAQEADAFPDRAVAKVDLVDDAHGVLEAAAKGDVENVAYSSSQLGSQLGTRLTAEEGPVYARAVLQRFGRDEHGRGLGGAALDDEHMRFADGLDIPRAQMPQIKAEHRGAMVNFLNARGIAHEEVTLPAYALRASQAEFNLEKVAKAKDFTGGDRAILIDKDNHVVDGHHQWVAAHDQGQDVRAIKLDATTQEVSKALEDMPSAETPGATTVAAPNIPENIPAEANSATDLAEGVGNMGAGIAEGMHSALLAKIERGDTTEIGQPSAILQVAAAIKKRGGTISATNMPELTQAYGAINETGDARQRALAAIVEHFAPTPSFSKQDQLKASQAKKKVARPEKPRKPMSVIAFVRRIGGIKNNEGHDLSKGRGLRRHPGLINNKSGLSVDEVGEALWEAGYIGTPEERPTVAEVLELLDEADTRSIYRQSEQADAEMDAAEEAGREQEEAARDDIKAVAAEAQLDLSEEEIDSALEYIVRGESTQYAIERVVYQSAGLDLLEVAAETQSEYEHADVADEIFASFALEADRSPEESSDRPVDIEGSPAASEATARQRPEAAASEGRPQATPERDTAGSEQLDAFGLQPGDERRALERQGEPRLRSTAKQKAPGEDGGLFDVQDRTADIFAGRDDPAQPAPPRAGLEALYDDEDTAKQIGWFDPETGAVEKLKAGQSSAAIEPVRARGEQPAPARSVTIDLADVDRIRDRLLQRMTELGIKDRFSLEVADGLRLTKDSTLAEIDLYRRIIRISLGRGDAEHSLDHEAIHALGPNGLRAITAAEWRVITDAAWADDRLREWAQTAPAYQGLSLEDQKEEAAAEYFADMVDAMRGRAEYGVPLGRVQGMLYRTAYRVGRLVNALRHAVSYLRTGQEAELRPIDVIVRLDRGVVGRRKGKLDGKPVSVTFGGKVLAQAEPITPTRSARSLTEARAAARAFVGKPLHNSEIGIDAVVSSNNLGKMTSASALVKSTSSTDHALAVANLDQLYPVAREVSRAPDARGEATILAIIRAEAVMRTADGRNVLVRMLVKQRPETASANPLYTIEVEEVGTRVGSGFTASTHGQGRNVAPAGPEAHIGDQGDDANIRSQAASRPLPIEGRSEERTPSGITRLAADIKTATPAFKRWFGESKVVDDAGKPVVMYHGTSRDQAGDAFTMFDTYASNYGLMGMGGYFTADPSVASAYTKKGRGETPTVYPVYLSIQNPIDMDAIADPTTWQKQFDGIEEFHEGGDTNESWYRAAEEVLMAEDLPMFEGAEAMQDGLRGMGYDGIAHLGGGRVHADGPRHRVFVAFDPEQIKSASGNAGTFDPTNPDIRAQAAAPPSSAIPSPLGRSFADDTVAPPRLIAPVRALVDAIGPRGTSQRLGAAIDNWRYTLQDRMLPMLRVQARIERSLGRPLTDAENAYGREEVMTGRVGAQLEHLTDQHVEPLFREMRKETVSPAELETFLYARHAKERNARIASINPEFGSDLIGEKGAGSGMTDSEADAIMTAVDESGKREALDRLASQVDALLEFGLNTRIEAGLLSEDEAKAWRATYQHYVPLRGRAGDSEAGDNARVSRQSGISVKGKESRRAFGRKSRANDILPYIMLQAQEAIVRAEQNRVAQAFHELATTAPEPDFWTINPVRRVAVFNKSTGQVSYRSESRITADDAPFTVSVKIKGEEQRVVLNRDNEAAVRVASAMRNLDAQKFHWVVGVLGKLNRFLSAVNTSLNPEFIVSNAIRDLQSGAINLSSRDLKGLVKGTLRDYPKALVTATKGEFGRSSGEWGRWYSELKLAGGRTYFNDVADLDQLRAKVERNFAKARNPLSLRAALTGLSSFIDHANGGVENALRLAAYKNARERGLSKQQAASIARNVTTNFTRKGSAGPVINAAYMFFNASMQGTATTFTALKSRRVQAIALAAVLLGFWQDWLNDKLADKDEDGQSLWDKTPEFQKSRNLILYVPGHEKAFKLTMSYGYLAFPNLGRAISEAMRGKPVMATAGNWLSSTMDSFNPVGSGGSILNALLPTIMDPVVDLVQNKDFTGKPIMPEQPQYGPAEPDAQRYWPTVQKHWLAVSEFLTKATGGDDVRPGAIDVSPETLEYMQGQVLGAAGATAGRALDLIEKGWSGEKIESEDIPFERQVVGGKPAWYDRALFYARVNEVEANIDYGREYQKAGDQAGLDKLIADRGDVLSLEGEAKAARKVMRQIRKERLQVEAAAKAGALDDETAKADRALLEAKEHEIVTGFNAAYFSAVRQPVAAD